MPATDHYQGSSSPFTSLGRSLLSIRRADVVVAPNDDLGPDSLDAFHRHVADLFSDLNNTNSSDHLLSLSWIQKLLESFLLTQESFRIILFNNRSATSRSPLDRLLADFFDRAVKALDVCNAVRDGVDQLRRWQRHADIALSALNAEVINEGQLRRARKSLLDLTALMVDDNNMTAASMSSHRNRSFGRARGSPLRGGAGANFRSLSWSVSRSWSAARQLQAIGANLSAPRGNEMVASHGVAAPVYAMSNVLLFAMWVLVAAIPCQDRGGLQGAHFAPPRSFPWAPPMLALHDRIAEEGRRKERRHACGLLWEIHEMERCVQRVGEVIDGVRVPVSEEKEAELREAAQELAGVCEVMKDGLEPLERLVREVFHRIVRSRADGLDCLAHNAE